MIPTIRALAPEHDQKADERGLRLLLLLDDDHARQRLGDRLRRERVARAIALPPTFAQAASIAHACDVIMLEGRFEGRDAVSVCRELRAQGISTPIVMLADPGSAERRANAPTLGVEDCFAMPLAALDVLTTVQAALRGMGGGRSAVLQVADLTLDPGRHRVMRGRRVVPVTRTEYAILEVLMRRAGELVTRSALLGDLWGTGAHPVPPANRLDVHLCNLRRKLAHPGETPLIHTIRGCGYLIDDARRGIEPGERRCSTRGDMIIRDEQAVEAP